MLVAGFADHRGVISRIAEHDHIRRRRKRQAANHLRRSLRRGAMFDAVLLAILFGVVRYLKRNPISRRCYQQAKSEAMTFFANDLLLAVPATFLWTSLPVSGAVCILCLLASLADQRRINQKQKLGAIPTSAVACAAAH